MQLRVVTDQPWDRPGRCPRRPVRRASRPSTARSARSIGAPAASSRPFTRSASCGQRASPRRRLAAAGAVEAARVLRRRRRRPGRPRPRDGRPLRGGRQRRLSAGVTSGPRGLADRRPLAGVLGDAAKRSGARRPRHRRGQLRPGDDLPRDTSSGAPPVLDELIVVAPGAGRAGPRPRPPSAAGSSARAPTSPGRLANRSSNDVSPEVLADEATAIAERHGLWIDVIGPEQAHRARHGHVHGGRPRQRQPAADDRPALRRGGREGRARAATWRSSARASASTRAASASSRPTGWKR